MRGEVRSESENRDEQTRTAAHTNTAVCNLERSRVVHTVTSDCDGMAASLKFLHDHELLIGRGSRKDYLVELG
jgi:hypothetical protein